MKLLTIGGTALKLQAVYILFLNIQTINVLPMLCQEKILDAKKEKGKPMMRTSYVLQYTIRHLSGLTMKKYYQIY